MFLLWLFRHFEWYSSYTHYFAKHVVDLLRSMTLKDAAARLDISWDTVKEIYSRYLESPYSTPSQDGVQAKDSKIPQLQKMTMTILTFKRGILAWYDCHISTGKVEGINNKIKVITTLVTITCGRGSYLYNNILIPCHMKSYITSLQASFYILSGNIRSDACRISWAMPDPGIWNVPIFAAWIRPLFQDAWLSLPWEQSISIRRWSYRN